MRSAVNRMRLTKQITSTVHRAAVADFETELVDFAVSPRTPEIDAQALGLLAGSNLRETDALHVAVAMSVDAERLVTSNRCQAEAATRAKLPTFRVI